MPKNTTKCPQPALKPGPLDLWSSALTMRSPHLSFKPPRETKFGLKNWEIQEIWVKVAVFDSLVREGKQHLVQVIGRFEKSRI